MSKILEKNLKKMTKKIVFAYTFFAKNFFNKWQFRTPQNFYFHPRLRHWIFKKSRVTRGSPLRNNIFPHKDVFFHIFKSKNHILRYLKRRTSKHKLQKSSEFSLSIIMSGNSVWCVQLAGSVNHPVMSLISSIQSLFTMINWFATRLIVQWNDFLRWYTP